MIFGSSAMDAVAFVVFGWAGALLFLPLAQWIDYKRDCKKYGKDRADENLEADVICGHNKLVCDAHCLDCRGRHH